MEVLVGVKERFIMFSILSVLVGLYGLSMTYIVLVVKVMGGLLWK